MSPPSYTDYWQAALKLLGNPPLEDVPPFRLKQATVWRIFLARLRVEAFIARSHWVRGYRGTDAVHDADFQRVLSTAWGICQQWLLLELAAPEESVLASWLARPSRAPVLKRGRVRRIRQIQVCRDALASAWQGWDGVAETLGQPSSFRAREVAHHQWQGLPVCPGQVQGVPHVEIRVFRQARPETVEEFDGAQGVLFIQGGVLSHACSVARERGIPCVTGLGKEFERAFEAEKPKRIEIDGASGLVRFFG